VFLTRLPAAGSSTDLVEGSFADHVDFKRPTDGFARRNLIAECMNLRTLKEIAALELGELSRRMQRGL